MPPSLGRVDLYWCPVVQSALSPEPGCSKGVSYVGFMCPSVVVEPWLLLAHQWVGMTLRLTGYEDGLLLQLIILCRGWSYGVGFITVGLWFLLSPPFCVLFMELIGDFVWTEAGHWECSFCGLLGGALVQAQISHCLCWAWWYLGEAMLQTQAGCHYSQAAAHLARDTGYTKASCCLFGGCESFRYFREVHSASQSQPLVTNSCWKRFWPVSKLCGAGSQGITRVGSVWWTLRFGVYLHLQAGWRKSSTNEQWRLSALLSWPELSLQSFS